MFPSFWQSSWILTSHWKSKVKVLLGRVCKREGYCYCDRCWLDSMCICAFVDHCCCFPIVGFSMLFLLMSNFLSRLSLTRKPMFRYPLKSTEHRWIREFGQIQSKPGNQHSWLSKLFDTKEEIFKNSLLRSPLSRIHVVIFLSSDRNLFNSMYQLVSLAATLSFTSSYSYSSLHWAILSSSPSFLNSGFVD